MGPWCHSQVNRAAENLGPLKWNGDTAADFRKNMLIPFFDTYLKDEKPAEALAPVLIYNPAENHWDKFADWPGVDEKQLTPLYLEASNGLDFQAAAAGEDSYDSDPAKPVPFLAPPVSFDDHARWTTWLVQDQRFVSTRPDVLSYQTSVLTQPVRVEGAPLADIFAKDHGHRWRFRRQDHRCVSADLRRAAGDGWLPATGQHGYLPWSIPQELCGAQRDPGR
jgi:predicted acyl esterase